MWFRDIDMEVWTWAWVYFSLTQRISLCRKKGMSSKYWCSLLMMDGGIYCYGWDEGIYIIICFPSTEAVLFPIPDKTCLHSAFKSLTLARYTYLSVFICGPKLVNPELASCSIKEGRSLSHNQATESCDVLSSCPTGPVPLSPACPQVPYHLISPSLFSLFFSLIINTSSTYTAFTSVQWRLWKQLLS